MNAVKFSTFGLLAIVLAAAGCTRGMDAPQDFVSVDRADLGGYDMRAVSDSGLVVGLRHEANADGGTLAFWAGASLNELKNQGYKHVKTEDVTGASGTAGKLMEFSVDQRGTTFTYLLAVYVNPREVLVAEAGGPAEDVTKHQDKLRKSLLSAK